MNSSADQLARRRERGGDADPDHMRQPVISVDQRNFTPAA
jgi:hypothetical protein